MIGTPKARRSLAEHERRNGEARAHDSILR
jgi:hypothetical protein